MACSDLNASEVLFRMIFTALAVSAVSKKPASNAPVHHQVAYLIPKHCKASYSILGLPLMYIEKLRATASALPAAYAMRQILSCTLNPCRAESQAALATAVQAAEPDLSVLIWNKSLTDAFTADCKAPWKIAHAESELDDHYGILSSGGRQEDSSEGPLLFSQRVHVNLKACH